MNRPRDLWLPDFDVATEVVMGQEWPLVVVTKWETNGIGERRYVETRVYQDAESVAAPPARTPTS